MKTNDLYIATFDENIDLLDKVGVTVKWKKNLAHLYFDREEVGIYTTAELSTKSSRDLFWWIIERIKSNAAGRAVDGPRHGW
jgi:hypothetical protein